MDKTKNGESQITERLTIKSSLIFFLAGMLVILAMGALFAMLYWLWVWLGDVMPRLIIAGRDFLESESPLAQFILIVVAAAILIPVGLLFLLWATQPPDPRKKKEADQSPAQTHESEFEEMIESAKQKPKWSKPGPPLDRT